MRRLLILFTLLPAILFAQDDKYLEGAVPVIDGKVVFSKEITATGLTQEELYNRLLTWSEQTFSEGKNRVAYTHKEKGDIAAIGEDYLVFSSTGISLDRALMSYRLTIENQNGLVKLAVSGIRYEYNVGYQSKPEKYMAEEWITDKYAVNKGKLIRGTGKFRKATIDYMDELFAGAVAAVGVENTVKRVPNTSPKPMIILPDPTDVSPMDSPAPLNSGTSSLEGYRQIAPDRIPGNIIKMLSEDWMLITAGNNEEFNMMTASWGGLGTLFGKPVATCYIHPARYTYQLMEKYDTYTFTFYTEAYREALQYNGSNSGRDKDKVKESGLTPITTPSGAKAFGEAWMIIECRKLISQPLTTEAINDPEVKKEWLGKPIHKMYIGEITNVWIK